VIELGAGGVLSQPPPCCNVSQAADWLDCVCQLATEGDQDAARILGDVAQHYIAAVRRGD